MSEYITINTEQTDDPDVLRIETNQQLTIDPIEVYPDMTSGEEGSPLAQTLFAIDGIKALTLKDKTMLVTREPGIEWFVLINEISAALKDFFL